MKDIVDGKVDLAEMEEQELKKERIDKAKEEIKRREKEESILKGRPGKGHQPGYKSFCKFCFTEFMIELPKCTNCKHDTMTYQVS